jgi:signal transduction histidine kinase
MSSWPNTQPLRRLVELSVTLNSTLDLDALLQLIIETAADLLRCQAASVLLYDEQKPHLYFAASTGSDPKRLAEVPVPLDGSLAGTIFRTGQALILNDVQKDPRHFPVASQRVNFEPHSFLGVPMRFRDRVIGVLEALNKRHGEFTDVDEFILSVIAAHAAVAINNARMMQALQQAYEKVKEADQLKSNFLMLASHELRTPLGIIIGYASFLREEQQGDVSENAQQVLSAALQMRALVEDMTNLTLLETDGLTFKPRDIAVQDLLRMAYEEIETMVNVKEQRVTFDLPVEPLLTFVDPEKTVSALTNILHNAVRFSARGGVIIVGARPFESQVIVWVADQGVGMTPEQLQKIFQPFYQAESPLTRRYGGLGIGLAIAKGLIESQGGKIWAESPGLGKGSTFKVLLPLGQA